MDKQTKKTKKSTTGSSISKKTGEIQKESESLRLKYYDEYRNSLTNKTQVVTETWLDGLRDRLLDWSAFEGDSKKGKIEAFRMEQFLDDMGIPHVMYERFCEKYPPLKQAHDIAIRRLAMRREYGAATGRYKDSVIKWTIALYDPKIREGLKVLAQLEKEDLQALLRGNIIIVDESKARLLKKEEEPTEQKG